MPSRLPVPCLDPMVFSKPAFGRWAGILRGRDLTARGIGWSVVLVAALGVRSGVSAEPELILSDTAERCAVALPVPDGWNLERSGAWQLQSAEDPAGRIPVQLVPALTAEGTLIASGSRLVGAIPPGRGPDGKRRFGLQPVSSPADGSAAAFQFVEVDDKSLKLLEGDKPVWVYNHGTVTDERLPERDGRRSRGCYVHPVWGLNGEVLTADFPPDHYHHHGIFWSWPHVVIDGKHYDLWVSVDIRQRFVRWLHRETGPAAAVLGVENGWFVGDQQVLTERIWLRVYRAGADERTIDLEMYFVPGEQPVSLEGSAGKSYGGLTVRFDVWPRRDAVVRVPERTVRHVGSSGFPADLADAVLRAPVRGLAGRGGAHLPGLRTVQSALPDLAAPDRGRSRAAGKRVRRLQERSGGILERRVCGPIGNGGPLPWRLPSIAARAAGSAG